jgi:hypothetical protein
MERTALRQPWDAEYGYALDWRQHADPNRHSIGSDTDSSKSIDTGKEGPNIMGMIAYRCPELPLAASADME